MCGVSGGPGCFYGANVALDLNSHALEERHVSAELQPILGFHQGAFTLALNPSLTTGFDGLGQVEFSPSVRLQYTLSSAWTLALEHYVQAGPVEHLRPLTATSQTLFAVAQRSFHAAVVELGVGWGLTGVSDPLTVKLNVSFDIR